jgi:hypothetical protein
MTAIGFVFYVLYTVLSIAQWDCKKNFQAVHSWDIGLGKQAAMSSNTLIL